MVCCAPCWRLSRVCPSAVISLASTRAMQLRLDLAQSPAPAAVLWELVGDAERHAAIAQLSALIAAAVVGPVLEASGEGAEPLEDALWPD